MPYPLFFSENNFPISPPKAVVLVYSVNAVLQCLPVHLFGGQVILFWNLFRHIKKTGERLILHVILKDGY